MLGQQHIFRRANAPHLNGCWKSQHRRGSKCEASRKAESGNGKRKKRKSQVPGSGPRLESPIGHASDMDTMIYGLQRGYYMPRRTVKIVALMQLTGKIHSYGSKVKLMMLTNGHIIHEIFMYFQSMLA